MQRRYPDLVNDANENDRVMSDRAAPHFVIVGSARSGTTLVQRLAAELPGVDVPPETHMLPWLDGVGVLHGNWPRAAQGQRALADRYAASAAMKGTELSGDRIVAAAANGVDTPMRFFDAVLRALVPSATVIGEKTPLHLLWAEALMRALPELVVIGVARDPRAVVHSQAELLREVSGSQVIDLALLARQAADDLILLDRLQAEERAIVLRYEDVVESPERARERIGVELGVDDVDEIAPSASRLYLDSEFWKERATGPVDPERAVRWRTELEPTDIELIEPLCLDAMERFGYSAGMEPASVSVPSDVAYDERRAELVARIGRATLGDPSLA